jgi:hypothetical protein
MTYKKKGALLVLILSVISFLGCPLLAESQQGLKLKHNEVGSAASGVEKNTAPRVHIHFIGPNPAITDNGTEKTTVYPLMPGPGQKVPFGNGRIFIYGFDKKPKLGIAIMKIEIFTREGRKDISCEVKADYGMPSMRGAHDTGVRSFSLSKKGDYLLPLDIVMPGDWEIRLTLLKEGKVIYKGRYVFNI